MPEIKAVTHTQPEKKKLIVDVQHAESGMKHILKIRLTFKCRIEEFKSLMETCKPGDYLLSDGVSSELVPGAVWKVELYPNGDREKNKGTVIVSFELAGQMEDGKEMLEATYHTYLLGASGNKIDVAKSNTYYFEGSYSWGWHVDHERVEKEKALHADGSLLAAADFEFLLPCDDEVTCKGCEDVGAQLESAVKEKEELGKANQRLEDQRDEAISERDGLKNQLDDFHSLEKLKKTCIELIAALGTSVYEGAAWTLGKFTFDLAEGVAAAARQGEALMEPR